MRLIIIAFLSIFSVQVTGQILTSIQEKVIRNTIGTQFNEITSANTVLNLGSGHFCSVNGERYFTPSGYHYIFKLLGDSAIRLDHSQFHGSDHHRFLFGWDNRIYSLGGYGHFMANNVLKSFNPATNEWGYQGTTGQKPKYIFGPCLQIGDEIYSFCNMKPGNNSEPDEADSTVYVLNLKDRTWKKKAPLTGLTLPAPHLTFYTPKYIVLQSAINFLVIRKSDQRYLLLNNAAFGITPPGFVNQINSDTLFFIKKLAPPDGHIVRLPFDSIFSSMKTYPLGLMKSESNLTLSNWQYMTGILIILSAILIWYKQRKKKNKNQVSTEHSDAKEKEDESFEKTSLKWLEFISNHPKSELSVDELDLLLKIDHLEMESKRLRRHRTIAEINRQSPGLITRHRHPADKRKYVYRISKKEGQ